MRTETLAGLKMHNILIDCSGGFYDTLTLYRIYSTKDTFESGIWKVCWYKHNQLAPFLAQTQDVNIARVWSKETDSRNTSKQTFHFRHNLLKCIDQASKRYISFRTKLTENLHTVAPVTFDDESGLEAVPEHTDHWVSGHTSIGASVTVQHWWNCQSAFPWNTINQNTVVYMNEKRTKEHLTEIKFFYMCQWKISTTTV